MFRKLPRAGYLLALICFLLPFVEVSCNGNRVVSLTGLQLLTGTQIHGQQVNPEMPVVASFLAGLGGLLFTLLSKRFSIVGGLFGLTAGCSLLVLQQSITSGAPPWALGLIRVEYQPGYFASLGLFFLSAVALFFGSTAESPRALPSNVR